MLTEDQKLKGLPFCYICDRPYEREFEEYIDENTTHLFTGYQPCKECQKLINQGFIVIGVTDKPTFDKQPPITHQEDKLLYPTQNIIILSKEIQKQLATEYPELHVNENTPGAFMPDDFVAELIKSVDKQLKEIEDAGAH